MDDIEPVEPAETEAEAETEQSFPELFGELATEVGTLVRQELSHAAEEMVEKARAAGRNLILVGVAALLGTVSLLVLAGALVVALGSVVPMWASALLIAGLTGAAGYALYRKASSALRAVDLMPHETFASLKDNRAWAKDEVEATREQISATMGEVRRRLEPPPPKKKRRAAPKRKALPK